MLGSIKIENKIIEVDFSAPIDLSIPLKDESNLNAWYVAKPTINPVKLGDWVGSTKKGASVNFNEIQFCPHSHVTHTETVGHVLTGDYNVNTVLKETFFFSKLFTVSPSKTDKDLIIDLKSLKSLEIESGTRALIIRTVPNSKNKKQTKYDNSNPPYFTKEAILFIVNLGIEHLLVDLPSVDKEKDNGLLVAHNTFWNTKGEIRSKATITEFVFVDNAIADGNYLLNLQIAPIDNNSSPSRPVIYKLK